MMQRGTQTLALTQIGVLTTRPHSKESRPEIQKSSGGRWGTRHGDGLLFPTWLLSQSGVTIDFQKLNHLTMSDTLCGIKNTNGVLSIRKGILEIMRFMVDFADGVLEATPEL